MSAWSEDELEAAVRVGDRDAVAHAVQLLDTPQAYTRGRACEILVTAPEPTLCRVLGDRFDQDPLPSEIWWRVVTLFAEAHDRLPAAAGRTPPVSRLAERAEDADADALFYLLRLHPWLAPDAQAAVVRAALASADPEVVVEGATLAERAGPLAPEVRATLGLVRGAARDEADLLLARAGDEAAVLRLVEVVRGGRPHAFEAMEAMERSDAARHSALCVALRPLWKRTVRASAVTARAAGCAAMLGEQEALSRLRQLASARRQAVRAVANAELARVGTDDDVEAVVRRVRDPYEAAAAAIVQELWRRDHPALRSVVVDAARSHRDPDARVAACECMARWMPDPFFAGVLRQICDLDGAPEVALAAEHALLGRGPR